MKRSVRRRVRNPETLPNGFRRLWAEFHYGSRKKALAQWKEKNLETLADHVVNAYRQQKIAKAKSVKECGFAENFPHTFRWLRDERYNDTITVVAGTDEQIAQEFINTLELE